MGKRRNRSTSHAEGGHGPKTESRIVKQLRSGPSHESTETVLEAQRRRAALEGKRRLVDDREQHDLRKRNSERTKRYNETRS